MNSSDPHSYSHFLQEYERIVSTLEIKQEIIDNPYIPPPPLPIPTPTFEISSSSHLQAQPSHDKYLLAATLLGVPDVDLYLKQMRLELRFLVEKWKNDYLFGRERNPLASELRESAEPQIHVDVDDSGKLFATYECVLCNRNFRIGFNKYNTMEGLKHKFNNGNFNSHLKIHFRE